jgi:malate dehydrogenase (oxaloacetate-decarboxylating)
MSGILRIDPVTGERYLAVNTRGNRILRDPLLNKGTAFTRRERDELALHGLLPPAASTIKKQLERTYENYQALTTDLDRFIYLGSLHDRNEVLFYRLVFEHIEEMLPIVYTPVVGEACQKFSHIFRRRRGLYIGYEHRDSIEHLLANTEIETPSIIVVTDGERILGLGDQGIGGMGIPIGKLALYTLCAGVSPFTTLPIMLDVGTDNEELLRDPLYLGMRHHRIRGAEYQAFIDSFVSAVQKVFPNVVLQWEDFLKENAINQLNRFRDRLCTFNDDIQGTAGVVVAGILGALRITRQQLRDQRVVFAGAGASANGIAGLIVAGMLEDGLSREEAQSRIYTVDRSGLVVDDRPGLDWFKREYAHVRDEVAGWDVRDPAHITLEEAIEHAQPTILVGTSTTPGLFTESIVRLMARINERPVILPLSNPTSKSECTARDAIVWSDGRAIVATGSPFDPVMYKGRRHRIGQANNAYIFPGVGLGLTVSRARRVTDTVFLAASKALAEQVTSQDLDEVALYPELGRIRECSRAVACATATQAVAEGLADEEVLEDLERRIDQAMWIPEYLPIRFEAAPVVYRDVAPPPIPVMSKGWPVRNEAHVERTIELIDSLRDRSQELIDEALSDLHQARLKHYESDGLETTRKRFRDLLERTLMSLETRKAEPIVEWAARVARERFAAGYDLFEVQTSINVFEEALWRQVLAASGPEDLAHALGLASAVLGMARDRLAREYLTLATSGTTD